MANEFKNIDVSTMNWTELRDFSQFLTLVLFMVAEFLIVEFTVYLKQQSKLQLLKEVIFYYLVIQYSIKFWRFVYGNGIIGSIKVTYGYVSKRVFKILLRLPPLKYEVAKELQKANAILEKDMMVTNSDLIEFVELPWQGLTNSAILDQLDKHSRLKHSDWENGKVSGAVYHGGKDLIKLQSEAYEKFSVANQLHPDAFPGLRKMESEIVEMCLKLFNAPETGRGTTSSGGTESLFLACLSAKTYGKNYRGISHPEIIAPVTVHAGVDKACYYLGIKLHKVAVGDDYKVILSKVKRHINSNTILLVGSAPNYPHGIIDDIEGLSRLAIKYNTLLHVDCCLGSFIVSFMRRSGVADATFPDFDFALPGVTSISCDTHKYGFAPKGSSIIMYRNNVLRASQYFIISNWVGGIYGSPTISGSRPGALMVGCWATMLKLGVDGYAESCRSIVGAAQNFKIKLTETIPELDIIGDPKLSVISFKSSVLNIYDLSDALSKKGWHLNALQNPPALHVAFTKLTVGAADQLLKDLQDTVKELVKKGSTAAKGDTAQLYGTAGNVATNGVVDQIVELFIDTMYKV